MREQGTRTSRPVRPPLRPSPPCSAGMWYPSRGWSGPRRGDGDRDGDVDEDEDGDGDVDRDKDEDGDRDGARNAVTSPPPSLQVAKAGEGGNTAGFWRWCGWRRCAGIPLEPPTLGLGHPGHGVSTRDLLAPVALLSSPPHRIEGAMLRNVTLPWDRLLRGAGVKSNGGCAPGAAGMSLGPP